ncbi:DUF421 domain-containing protein [Sorangium sp. So ce394]|uniref:DUF421 domain-containing protein n=1 Tax=Sorangium sp. So ce394 TaxID=3133310 RepID=UPI003F5C0DF8
MEGFFGFSKPLWQIALRTTLVYLALVILIRVIPKRRTGHLSPNDMLALILIGGMAADGIMGGSTSPADVLLMIALIVAWGYVLDILEFRVPFLRRYLRDAQTVLVRDGRPQWRNMRREMVTEEELQAALRRQGITDIATVRSACLEADGEISVVKEQGAQGGEP